MSVDGGLPPPVMPIVAQPAVGKRRRGWMLVGSVLLLAGLVGGGVLLTLAQSAEGRTVRRFARAPIGCTTTLQFDRGGVFTFYVETAGRTAPLGGDCTTAGKTFLHRGSAPTVSLELTDSSGAPVALSNYQGQRYDASGFVGRSLAQASIPAAGTYRVAATADVADIGLAVGGSAVAYRNELVTWGAIALMVGGVVGGALLTFGARRRRPAPVELLPAVTPPWAPPSV
jgi:hypothetical protein